MKKLRLFLLALAVLLLLSIVPSMASADTHIFAVQYSFDQDVTGTLGGLVDLTLEVSNRGTQDIQWLAIQIDTQTVFNKRWSDMHLKPQQSMRLYAEVLLQPADLDVTKRFQVAVGTGAVGTPSVDDLTVSFQIRSTQDLLGKSVSLSKSGQVYTGDQVDFSFQVKNLMEAKIENLKLFTALNKNGQTIYSLPMYNVGDLSPGQSATKVLQYEFRDGDTGSIKCVYAASYHYLGKFYSESKDIKTFTVEEKPAPSPSASVPVSPSPDVSATPSPASPSIAAEASPAVTASPDTAVQADPGTAGVSYTWLYIVIAAVVVVAGGVTAILLVRKKRPGRQQ